MTKIAAVIVGTDEERFRNPQANDERMALAKRIAEFTRTNADVVLLPAGYLTVETAARVTPEARKLARVFGDQMVLAGIDEVDDDGPGAKPRAGKLASGGAVEGYHYWAFASNAGALLADPWQQRSATSNQEVADSTARCVTSGSNKIGVLICGEIYSPALATSLAQAQPDLIVDLAHRSMTRFTKSLHRIAKTTRSSVFHVQHVAIARRSASKWRATRQRVSSDCDASWASYELPDRSLDALWAEVKIWNE